MFLLDTNVWLEALLEQTAAGDVVRLLGGVPTDRLFLTDFTLNSIALKLTDSKLKKWQMSLERRVQTLSAFVNDIILGFEVSVVRLERRDVLTVIRYHARLRLDYEDACQYVAARKYDLTLVSLDSDFDRTKRGRKTPAQALADYLSRKTE